MRTKADVSTFCRRSQFLQLFAGASFAALSMGALDASSANEPLQSAIDAIDKLEAAGFTGSVLAACGADVIFRRDIFENAENGKIIRYDVASVTKWLTAIAVLSAVDDGILSLNDPISSFFADAPDDKRRITVRQLLTHQSGLPQAYAAEGRHSRTDAAMAVFGSPLDFPPGESFRYSNDNYSLLAAILEIASGISYTDFLSARVLSPLGLDPASFWPTPPRDHEWFPPLLSPLEETGKAIDWGFLGGHGARLSVEDMHRILTGLQDGTLLSPSSIALLRGPHVLLNSGIGVGMGWYLDTDEAGRRRG
ncbi:MAG: serine hydrolase [Alphaproteobacteria bacterium]|nr:serine hydrolase [Alphaproteobacteria bacterium]